MIAYCVKRRWFAEKAHADKYRVAEGLPPSATLKLQVVDRNDLVALLNALCSPPAPGEPLPLAALPATAELVDRAYVSPAVDIPDCVPDFLLKAHGLRRE